MKWLCCHPSHNVICGLDKCRESILAKYVDGLEVGKVQYNMQESGLIWADEIDG